MATQVTVELLNRIVKENRKIYTAYRGVYEKNGYVLASSSISDSSYVVSDENGNINMKMFSTYEENDKIIEEKYGISLR